MSPGILSRRLLALGLGLAACAGACGAGGSEPAAVFHGVPHDMLYGLSVEGREAIAVGDFGLVVESGDGGRTWSRQAKVPTEAGLFAVVRKAGHCIAGGQQGLLLVADDCRQWRRVPAASTARILAVDVNAGGTGYAVGGFGAVLKTSDWGRSWQPLAPDWKELASDGAEPHLYDVHVGDDGEVTVAGEFETILRSRDGGATWSPLHRGKRSLFGLKVLENGEIYAVGQEGAILKSADRGGHWTELASGSKAILTGIWARADGQVVASGIYTILYSEDGGHSWRQDRSRPGRSGWHQAVAGSEGGGGLNVVLVGSGGAILSVER